MSGLINCSERKDSQLAFELQASAIGGRDKGEIMYTESQGIRKQLEGGWDCKSKQYSLVCCLSLTLSHSFFTELGVISEKK